MIFFFDRSIGVKIPEALRHVRVPNDIELHQEHFAQNEQDDVWLSQVGVWGWIVFGQDYKYHEMPSELAAIRQHNVGCFYLWGSEAPRWETMRVFAKAYDKIVRAATVTPRPFVFEVRKNGGLSEVII